MNETILNSEKNEIALSKKAKTFTLVEMMVSIAIIATLAGIITISISGGRAQGRDARRIQDLKTLATAIETYDTNVGSLPFNTFGDSRCVENLPQFIMLVDQKYLAQIPQDPLYNATACAGGQPSATCHCYAYTSPATTGTGQTKDFKISAAFETLTGTEAQLAANDGGMDGTRYEIFSLNLPGNGEVPSSTICTGVDNVVCAQGVAPQLAYYIGATSIAGATNTYFDSTNGNLGIGLIGAPNSNYKLDVGGKINGVQLCIAGNCISSWSGVTAYGNIITGTGTENNVAKFNGAHTITNAALIYDNGSSVGINTSSPNENVKLDVNGKIRLCDGSACGILQVKCYPDETGSPGTCYILYDPH